MKRWRMTLFIPFSGIVAGCTIPVSKLDIRPAIWSRTWFADYPSAEKFATESNKPLLIYFKDSQPWTKDPVEDSLRAWPLADHTEHFVRVVLLRSYEPDRRLVRQYGVVRAPAIILVHADGTYHAISSDLTQDHLAQFFKDSIPPGATPNPDPFLSQPNAIAWQTSLEDAERQGSAENRAVFVVLDRPWSRDWERLAPMVNRPEVRSRVASMVPCRPMPIWKIGADYAGRFNVRNLPAIVVLHPDSTYQSLEMPNSYEAIVRFLDDEPVDQTADPANPVERQSTANATDSRKGGQ